MNLVPPPPPDPPQHPIFGAFLIVVAIVGFLVLVAFIR